MLAVHLTRWACAVIASALPLAALAQSTVTALCSTDQSWCEMAAVEFQKATGIRVLQVRNSTGEALAQLRAEAANFGDRARSFRLKVTGHFGAS